MSSSAKITDYLGSGTAASRPASLTLPSGAVGFYYATDTTVLSAWTGAAWVSIVYTQGTQTVAGATATVTPLAGQNSILITLQANTTLTIANGVYGGQKLRLELLQDGTGSRTVAFSSSVEFGTTITSYTATTAANKRDLVDLIWSTAAGKWMFYNVAKGFA
jgi:hypothetical protein